MQHPTHDRAVLEAVADAVKNARDPDLFEALVFVALEETHDLGEAVKIASQILKEEEGASPFDEGGIDEPISNGASVDRIGRPYGVASGKRMSLKLDPERGNWVLFDEEESPGGEPSPVPAVAISSIPRTPQEGDRVVTPVGVGTTRARGAVHSLVDHDDPGLGRDVYGNTDLRNSKSGEPYDYGESPRSKKWVNARTGRVLYMPHDPDGEEGRVWLENVQKMREGVSKYAAQPTQPTKPDTATPPAQPQVSKPAARPQKTQQPKSAPKPQKVPEVHDVIPGLQDDVAVPGGAKNFRREAAPPQKPAAPPVETVPMAAPGLSGPLRPTKPVGAGAPQARNQTPARQPRPSGQEAMGVAAAQRVPGEQDMKDVGGTAVPAYQRAGAPGETPANPTQVALARMAKGLGAALPRKDAAPGPPPPGVVPVPPDVEGQVKRPAATPVVFRKVPQRKPSTTPGQPAAPAQRQQQPTATPAVPASPPAAPAQQPQQSRWRRALGAVGDTIGRAASGARRAFGLGGGQSPFAKESGQVLGDTALLGGQLPGGFNPVQVAGSLSGDELRQMYRATYGHDADPGTTDEQMRNQLVDTAASIPGSRREQHPFAPLTKAAGAARFDFRKLQQASREGRLDGRLISRVGRQLNDPRATKGYLYQLYRNLGGRKADPSQYQRLTPAFLRMSIIHKLRDPGLEGFAEESCHDENVDYGEDLHQRFAEGFLRFDEAEHFSEVSAFTGPPKLWWRRGVKKHAEKPRRPKVGQTVHVDRPESALHGLSGTVAQTGDRGHADVDVPGFEGNYLNPNHPGRIFVQGKNLKDDSGVSYGKHAERWWKRARKYSEKSWWKARKYAEGDPPQPPDTNPRDFRQAQVNNQARNYQRQQDNEAAARQSQSQPPPEEPAVNEQSAPEPGPSAPQPRQPSRPTRGSAPLLDPELYNILHSLETTPIEVAAHPADVAALRDWYEEYGTPSHYDDQTLFLVNGLDKQGWAQHHAGDVMGGEAYRLAGELGFMGPEQGMRDVEWPPLDPDDPEEWRIGKWLEINKVPFRWKQPE